MTLREDEVRRVLAPLVALGLEIVTGGPAPEPRRLQDVRPVAALRRGDEVILQLFTQARGEHRDAVLLKEIGEDYRMLGGARNAAYILGGVDGAGRLASNGAADALSRQVDRAAGRLALGTEWHLNGARRVASTQESHTYLLGARLYSVHRRAPNGPWRIGLHDHPEDHEAWALLHGAVGSRSHHVPFGLRSPPITSGMEALARVRSLLPPPGD